MIKESKYIIRRIIIGVGISLCLMFINSCEVHAATNGDMDLTNGINAITYSPSAQFYDNRSGTLATVETGWFTDHYMTSSELTTNATGYGASIAFQLNETLVKDSRYAITIYVQNYNRVQLRYVERYGNKLIACYSQANCISNFNDNISNTIIQFAGNNVTNIQGGADYFGNVTALTYIIDIKNNNANWLLLPYTTFSTSTAYNLFFGYNVSYLGLTDQVTNSTLQSAISNSGLASASSVNQVQSSVTQVQEELSNVDSSIQTQTQQQHQDHQETINTITDSSIPSDSNDKINSVISSTQTQNANISDLVNFIPNTLQVIINGFNNSCTGGYSLGSLFGTELVIPCINPVDYLGSFLWGVIDSILCLCYLIPLCKFLVNKYNDLTSLKNLRWQ